MTALERLLGRLEGVTRSGEGWAARCPAHDDRRASLSISAGEEGRVLLCCHAGCSPEEIVRALGLELGDLFERGRASERRIVSRYGYVDEVGALLFETVRYEPKEFRQRRPDGGGGWRWNLGEVRRVLYRLPAVLAAVERGDPVYVCEGEKDVEALERLGVVATCNPMGAGKWRAEYGEHLRGAEVRIVADRDEAGRAHAHEVASALQLIAGSVVVLEPAEGKDVFDHLATGRTLDQLLPVAAEGAASEGDSPPVEGAALLEELGAFLGRFVAMSSAQADALALWVVHSYAVEAAETTPYLHVSAPEKQSGKTRLLEVLSVLVKNALAAANTTEAALFRSIEQLRPTLLMDEVDAVFGAKAKGNHEDLRALLNAGYRRGSPVLRCVGDGSRQRVEQFETFCPKALAGIGELPDTLADRSLPVRLKRRTRSEPIERFRRRRAEAEASPLRERLARFAEEQLERLTASEPSLPEELSDRAQEAFEPLFAIADLAGGGWPARARTALVSLRQGTESVEEGSLGVRLLADSRTVFGGGGAEQLPSAELIEGLAALEEAPWGDFRGGGPVKARTLASLLRPYGIRPRDLRVGERALKGYRREDFADAWSRYLPAQHAKPETAPRADGDPIRDMRDIPLPEPVSAPSVSATEALSSRNGGAAGRLQEAVVAHVAEGAGPRRRAPCRYPGHRSVDWRAPGGRRVCGVCHPPAPGARS